MADTDPWGIGRQNLTPSVRGINVPAELDTLLKVFMLASLVFQSNPGIGERELHPIPLGRGRVWAISCGPRWARRLSSEALILCSEWFLRLGGLKRGSPVLFLTTKSQGPYSSEGTRPGRFRLRVSALALWAAGSQALQTGIWTSSPSCPLIAFSCVAQPPLASHSVPKTRPVLGAECPCQGLICRYHRSIFSPSALRYC